MVTECPHLLDIQHAKDLWCDAGSQPLKQATLAPQLLNGSHILISHLHSIRHNIAQHGATHQQEIRAAPM
jgi:hypothetical protein